MVWSVNVQVFPRSRETAKRLIQVWDCGIVWVDVALMKKFIFRHFLWVA